jgi:lysozyme family protein
MAASNYEASLALVLKSEGGFVNHPSDPGGATNLGITRGTLAAYRGHPVTVDDVRTLSRAEAAAIYRANYWDKVRGDELPAGLDYQTFDYAVNSGPARAVMALQDSLGVAPDGRIGPLTIKAAAVAKVPDVIRAVTRERMAFLRRLSTWPVFGRGWTSRVTVVEVDALRMVTAAPLSAPVAPPAPQPASPPSKIVELPAAQIAKPQPTWWDRLLGRAA